MLGISYSNWERICNMYFEKPNLLLQNYLQQYPFSKLSQADKDNLITETFYENYIKSGNFMLYPEFMTVSENFLQKSDGTFRDSSLISPILFLVLQAIGKEISEKYKPVRPEEISVYYSGNYEKMRPFYKEDYDEFYKELNYNSDYYKYFIKTDITNFFSNVDVDKLFNQIDKICNDEASKDSWENKGKPSFSQTQLLMYKELLKYCGNGKFPTIENSIACSYLSTVVYLDEIDKELYSFLKDIIFLDNEFQMVRYVDDCYILFSSEKTLDEFQEDYNEIINKYSSILKKYGMKLNIGKCSVKKMEDLNAELRQSLYDEEVMNEKSDILKLFKGSFEKFLDDLLNVIDESVIDIKTYKSIIDRNFSFDDIIFSPNEVFNHYAYNEINEFKDPKIRDKIVSLVQKDISVIRHDPRRLTNIILKTKEEDAIKYFLNNLFDRNRSGKWNSYDTQVLIQYLLQRRFKHTDLLDILMMEEEDIYKYYVNNCKDSFMKVINTKVTNQIGKIILEDEIAHFLFFMSTCKKNQGNLMEAHAYFKSFFDRFTADLAYYKKETTKPNYKGFYNEKTLKNYYKDIKNSDIIIETAAKLRNSNPVAHASSELLKKYTSEYLVTNMNDLKKLIEDKIIYEYPKIK